MTISREPESPGRRELRVVVTWSVLAAALAMPILLRLELPGGASGSAATTPRFSYVRTLNAERRAIRKILADAGAEIDRDPTLALFANRASGDIVTVEYSTRGCFHHASYELRFDGSEVTVSQIPYTYVEEEGGQGKLVREAAVELGKLTLTPGEFDELDRLVVYYRGLSYGGCTTEETFEITVQSADGATFSTESLSDSTCQLLDLPGVGGIGALAARLPPKAL